VNRGRLLVVAQTRSGCLFGFVLATRPDFEGEVPVKALFEARIKPARESDNLPVGDELRTSVGPQSNAFVAARSSELATSGAVGRRRTQSPNKLSGTRLSHVTYCARPQTARRAPLRRGGTQRRRVARQ
jgi:hypothetical protein